MWWEFDIVIFVWVKLLCDCVFYLVIVDCLLFVFLGGVCFVVWIIVNVEEWLIECLMLCMVFLLFLG